ncbi:MAG: Holliday junction resolvase RuvX [Rickettsiales bacterium]|nr:Holliday junction resolvase RuvX [Rickettsiales bacterium]
MIIKSVNLFKNNSFREKKVLSIDFGLKKLGFAYSNHDQTIAFPHVSLRRADHDSDLIQIKNILISLNIDIIVVGLPFNNDRGVSKTYQQVKSFANLLVKNFDIDLFFWDERFTTTQAQKFLKSEGLTGKEADKFDDIIAAQIILDSFLQFKNS